MAGEEVCFTPSDPSQYMSVAPPPMSVPEEAVCTPVKPPPKKKEEKPATYTPPPKPKVEAQPNMSFVEGGVCVAPEEPNMSVAPPPPAVDDKKPKLAKLERLGKIYEDTVFNWAENHKVAKKGDGWAMHAMDWAFASDNNKRYEQQEATLKSMYANFQGKIKAGDLEGAKAAYDALMDKIKSFGGEAHRLNNTAIERAETAQTVAEYTAKGSAVVFVAAGTVVAAPAVAAAGVWAGGGAVGFGVQVGTGAVLVGGMEAGRMAVTKGTAAAAGNYFLGDHNNVFGAAVDGAGTGFVDGAIGGAGGVVAGKLITGAGVVVKKAGDAVIGKGVQVMMSTPANAAGAKAVGDVGAAVVKTGYGVRVAGIALKHGGHWVHHGLEHMAHSGNLSWGGVGALTIEQLVKYGIVKPGGKGGYAYVSGTLFDAPPPKPPVK